MRDVDRGKAIDADGDEGAFDACICRTRPLLDQLLQAHLVGKAGLLVVLVGVDQLAMLFQRSQQQDDDAADDQDRAGKQIGFDRHSPPLLQAALVGNALAQIPDNEIAEHQRRCRKHGDAPVLVGVSAHGCSLPCQLRAANLEV